MELDKRGFWAINIMTETVKRSFPPARDEVLAFHTKRKRRTTMLKKILLALSLVVLAALALAVLGAAAEEDLVPLTLINKTDQGVTVTLASGDVYYYLYVPAGEERAYTVQRLTYTHNTWACGGHSTGSVPVKIVTRWVFTACGRTAPNWGEPYMEKIHIDDAPDGKNWVYKHE
jgi:hypothetical protein